MVLISIDPFTLRKVLLIGVAVLGFSAFCFADPVLMARRYTPGPGRLDGLRTQMPTSQRTEQPVKALLVEPETVKCEVGGQGGQEAGWRSRDLWASLRLPSVELASGFSLRAMGVGSDVVD